MAEVDGRHLALLQEGQQKQPLAQHGCKPERKNTAATKTVSRCVGDNRQFVNVYINSSSYGSAKTLTA